MPTYTPLQSIVLTSSASTVTFSNIPQTYQDLQLIVSSPTSTGNDSFLLRINGDTGTTYSNTTLDADGSSATSRRRTGLTYIVLQEKGGASDAILKTGLLNYSNTTTYKTVIGTATQASGGLSAHAGLWRSTVAISSITLFLASSLTYAAGTTFDLYGISPVAAQNASATGGTDIFYDSTYVYHVFKGSGTFTPARNLTVDYLVVAGGGGGGSYWTPIGSNGGSGGGGGTTDTYPTGYGTGSQGSNGGIGYTQTGQSTWVGGGGGGYSTAGANGGNATGGSGGNGTSAYSSWGAATSTGQNSSGTYYYAGGGGGGTGSVASSSPTTGGLGGGGAGGKNNGYGGGTNSPVSGTTNTGGGGGGGNNGGVNSTVAAPGGSGIVIVRYAR